MRILTVAWSIFSKTDFGFEIARNGGAIMISDIAEYIGRKEEAYLFQGAISLNDMQYGHIEVLGNSEYVLGERTKDNIDVWQRSLSKCFEELLINNSFDYILIQGGGEFCFNCVNICRRLKRPFSFVCHLLNKDGIFLVDDLKVIMVGSKMKEDLLSKCPNIEEKNVSVILNGVPRNASDEFLDRKKKNKKTLLCSASLQPRKNQIQLVRAFSLLPEKLKRNIEIVFCGKESVKYPILKKMKEEIKKNKLDDNVTYIGTKPRHDMPKVYSGADGLALPSLHEGLSLAVLEMLQYGKPVIMFADNETAYDINDSKVAILVKEHTDQALARAIVEWYEKDWDEDYIKSYSEYYTMERVADDYISYCRKMS